MLHKKSAIYEIIFFRAPKFLISLQQSSDDILIYKRRMGWFHTVCHFPKLPYDNCMNAAEDYNGMLPFTSKGHNNNPLLINA